MIKRRLPTHASSLKSTRPRVRRSYAAGRVKPPGDKDSPKKPADAELSGGEFWCPRCREEIIDLKYLDYYGGICQKCGYDFYTGWIH